MRNLYSRLLVTTAAFVLTVLAVRAQDQTIVLTTAKAVGESVTLRVNHTYDGVAVNWGGATTETYKGGSEPVLTITGTLEGNTITLTGSKYLSTLICADNRLTAIDVSGAKLLRSLYVQNNELTALNLSGLTELTDLNAANNKLAGKLSLSATVVPKLQTLDLSGNAVTSISNSSSTNFTGAHTGLSYVRIDNTSFTRVYTSSLPSIDYMNCENTPVANVTLATSTATSTPLTTLNIAGGSLSSIDVSKALGLKQLYLDGNNLKTLDLSAHTALSEVSVPENELSSLLLPSQKLRLCDIRSNYLYFRALPRTTAQATYAALTPQGAFPFVDASGNAITQVPKCPSYADRSNSEYILDMTAYRTDGNNRAQATIKFFDLAEDGVTATELTPYNSSTGEGDYVMTGSKYVFLTAHPRAFVQLTHSLGYYKDYSFVSEIFTIGDELPTGIADVSASAAYDLKVSIERGGIALAPAGGAVKVSVVDAAGRRVWSGLVKARTYVSLPAGVYVVNGRKIAL